MVAVSGFPDAADEALRRGAVRFAAKPLSLEGLHTLVESALSGDEAARRALIGEAAEVEERRLAARAVGEAATKSALMRPRRPRWA